MAQVTFEDDAISQFEDLPAKIKQRVIGIVQRLTQWPEVSGAKALRGELAGHYRIRTGDYRVQFRIEFADKSDEVEDEGDDSVEAEVVIERIGHRDGFYED